MLNVNEMFARCISLFFEICLAKKKKEIKSKQHLIFFLYFCLILFLLKYIPVYFLLLILYEHLFHSIFTHKSSHEIIGEIYPHIVGKANLKEIKKYIQQTSHLHFSI
jgi:hypothetical protein